MPMPSSSRNLVVRLSAGRAIRYQTRTTAASPAQTSANTVYGRVYGSWNNDHSVHVLAGQPVGTSGEDDRSDRIHRLRVTGPAVRELHRRRVRAAHRRNAVTATAGHAALLRPDRARRAVARRGAAASRAAIPGQNRVDLGGRRRVDVADRVDRGGDQGGRPAPDRDAPPRPPRAG